MAKTPPCHLPNIPGVTSPGEAGEEPKADANSLNHQEGKPSMGKGPPGWGRGDLGWRRSPLTLLSLPLARGRCSVRDGYLSGNHGEAATPQTCAPPIRLSRIRPGEAEVAAVPTSVSLPACLLLLFFWGSAALSSPLLRVTGPSICRTEHPFWIRPYSSSSTRQQPDLHQASF